jgi:hypothetical protein
VAVTVKVAVAGGTTAWLAGWAVMTGAALAVTVMRNDTVALPAELVAVTVYTVRGESSRGVPEMIPVTVSRPSPRGRAGATR